VGRILIYIGIALIAVGALISFTPIRLGRLPGDIVIRGKNSTFYFPIVTCVVLSVLLTIVSWLFSRR